MRNDTTSWADRSSEELKADYPGVEPAFGFVRDSYAWLITRYQAAEGRLQALIALMIPFTVGALGILKAIKPLIAYDEWFWLAMAAFVAAMAIGAGTLLTGTIHILSPGRLYPDWATASDTEFKINLLIHSAADFEHNLAQIDRKSNGAMVVFALFVAEAALLVTWLAAS